MRAIQLGVGEEQIVIQWVTLLLLLRFVLEHGCLPHSFLLLLDLPLGCFIQLYDNMEHTNMNVIVIVDLLHLVETIHHSMELMLLQFAFLLDCGVQHHLTIQTLSFTETQLLQTFLQELFLRILLPLGVIFKKTYLIHLIVAFLLEFFILLSHTAKLPLLIFILIVALDLRPQLFKLNNKENTCRSINR